MIFIIICIRYIFSNHQPSFPKLQLHGVGCWWFVNWNKKSVLSYCGSPDLVKLHVYIYIYIYIYMCVCVCVFVRLYVCFLIFYSFVCMYIIIYIYIYYICIHVYTHVYIYIYIYIYIMISYWCYYITSLLTLIFSPCFCRSGKTRILFNTAINHVLVQNRKVCLYFIEENMIYKMRFLLKMLVLKLLL